jgi:hypothetical protein
MSARGMANPAAGECLVWGGQSEDKWDSGQNRERHTDAAYGKRGFAAPELRLHGYPPAMAPTRNFWREGNGRLGE